LVIWTAVNYDQSRPMLRLYDFDTKEFLETDMPWNGDGNETPIWSEDGSRFYFLNDAGLHTYDANKLAQFDGFTLDATSPKSLQKLDANHMAVITRDNRVCFYNVNSGALISQTDPHEEDVVSLTFNSATGMACLVTKSEFELFDVNKSAPLMGRPHLRRPLDADETLRIYPDNETKHLLKIREGRGYVTDKDEPYLWETMQIEDVLTEDEMLRAARAYHENDIKTIILEKNAEPVEQAVPEPTGEAASTAAAPDAKYLHARDLLAQAYQIVVTDAHGLGKADQLYREAASIDESAFSSEDWVSYGLTRYLLLDDYANTETLRIFSNALKEGNLDRSDAGLAYAIRGSIYAVQEEYDRAIKDFDSALALCSSENEWSNFGITRKLLKEFRDQTIELRDQ